MGKIATSNLDNGTVGLEITYGGMEAPFGGIDASKAPRYIDPNCFADASNFLVVDGELCICTLVQAYFPPNPGITYPYEEAVPGGLATLPIKLIGVGKLPCEGLVKKWALFTGNAADSSNLWHYRLILWTEDVTETVESYDFLLPGQTVYAPAKNAQATVTFSYNSGLTAWQTTPAYSILPGPATPSTIDGNFYDFYTAFASIGGTPTTGTPYNNVIDLGPEYALFTGSPTTPTPTTMASSLAAFIGSVPNAFPFTAAVSSGDPQQVILTATTGPAGYSSVDGSLGNLLTLSIPSIIEEFGYYPLGGGSFIVEFSPAYGGLNPSPFTRPSVTITITPFTGGADGGELLYSNLPIQELSWETVGDNLYLAGWPAGYMLSFNNSTKQFNILTSYQGERVIKKFAGRLIGIGLINSFEQFETENWLWLNWSTTNDFAQWDDIDSNGNATGAGGEQLADVSDMLTGLVVSNSTAFILRAEGLSYATALQGAELPFDINHVALAKDGQGCPSTALWTQFDQLGFYVGTSNVFLLGQSPQAVGNKILEVLFPALTQISAPAFADATYAAVNTEALTLTTNNRPLTLFAVHIEGIVYVYSPADGTWMRLNTTAVFPFSGIGSPSWFLKAISLPRDSTTGYDGSYRTKGAYMGGQEIIHVPGHYDWQAPVLYEFQPAISAEQDAFVLFPMEEIAFGRDITIDSLYVLLCGIPGVAVQFTLNGLIANLNPLEPASFVPTSIDLAPLTLDENAAPGNYQEYQVFSQTGEALTLHSPQLKMKVAAQTPPAYTPTGLYPNFSEPYFKVAKITMFGSFDPTQRPT